MKYCKENGWGYADSFFYLNPKDKMAYFSGKHYTFGGAKFPKFLEYGK